MILRVPGYVLDPQLNITLPPFFYPVGIKLQKGQLSNFFEIEFYGNPNNSIEKLKSIHETATALLYFLQATIVMSCVRQFFFRNSHVKKAKIQSNLS